MAHLNGHNPEPRRVSVKPRLSIQEAMREIHDTVQRVVPEKPPPKLTQREKREAVVAMLQNPQARELSFRQVATKCGVSHTMVNEIAREIGYPSPSPLDASAADNVSHKRWDVIITHYLRERMVSQHMLHYGKRASTGLHVARESAREKAHAKLHEIIGIKTRGANVTIASDRLGNTWTVTSGNNQWKFHVTDKRIS